MTIAACRRSVTPSAIRIPSSSERSFSGIRVFRRADTGKSSGDRTAFEGKLGLWETKILENVRRRRRLSLSRRLSPDGNAKTTARRWADRRRRKNRDLRARVVRHQHYQSDRRLLDWRTNYFLLLRTAISAAARDRIRANPLRTVAPRFPVHNPCFFQLATHHQRKVKLRRSPPSCGW